MLKKKKGISGREEQVLPPMVIQAVPSQEKTKPEVKEEKPEVVEEIPNKNKSKKEEVTFTTDRAVALSTVPQTSTRQNKEEKSKEKTEVKIIRIRKHQ